MVRFFHFADVHLGIEYDSHSPTIRQFLRSQMRQAFQDMVSRAISEAVDAVLIAGDLLDASSIDPRNEIFLIQQMTRLGEANISVYLVQGNHDVAQQLKLPYVHTFGSQVEVVATPNYRIVGQSFERPFDLRTIQDLPVFDDDLPTIGLFHSQLQTSLASDNRSSYLATTVEQLEAAGYDYYALGHVHERQLTGSLKQIGYPGSFFPVSKAETGRRGYYDVKLSPGLKVQFIPSSDTAFHKLEAVLQSGDDFRIRTYEQLKDLIKPGLLMQIRLTGLLQAKEIQDLPEIMDLIQEEAEHEIDFLDQTQIAPQADFSQNPFFDELLNNLDDKVFARIDTAELYQQTPQEYRLWYAKHKDHVRRMLLEAFYEKGQS